MSIKTFPGGPDKNLESFLIFFGISIVIHLAVLWVLYAFAPAVNRVIKGNEPLLVDVVDLPPSGETIKTNPKTPPTHYAGRSQTVEKETYPEPRPTRRPGAARIVPVPQSNGAKNGKGVMDGNKATKEAVPSNRKNESATSKGVQENKSAASSKTTDAEKAGVNTAKKAEDPKTSEKAVSKPESTIKSQVLPHTPEKNTTAPALPETGNNTRKPTNDATKNQPQKPNLFLSDDRITELEKKYEADPNKGEKGKTLQLNTAEVKYSTYILNMKKKIEFYWEYPLVAAKNGWQGKVRIDFTIHKDGKVAEITVVKSSGYPVLDDAAVTALRLATPFAPFPGNFEIEDFTIRGTFEYDIYEPRGRPGQP